jgi:hypothetical protein
VEAGPIYEVWTVNIDAQLYKRLGISDEIPMGTGWEKVPGAVLVDISLGAYGPLGASLQKELYTQNG